MAINSVQFGWSQKNPPDPKRYQIPIDHRFISIQKNKDRSTSIKPTALLIQRLLKETQDPDGPRFAVITGLKKQLKLTTNQIYEFQKITMEKLAPALKSKLFTDTSPEVDGLTSTHYMHFDGSGGIPLLSLAYGSFKGVIENEGIPKVADFKQWLKDQNKLKLAWLFKCWPNQENLARESLYFLDHIGLGKQYINFDKKYTIELNDIDYKGDIPLIFLNNDKKEGVTHGAGQLEKTKKAKENDYASVERPIVRQYSVLK